MKNRSILMIIWIYIMSILDRVYGLKHGIYIVKMEQHSGKSKVRQ